MQSTLGLLPLFSPPIASQMDGRDLLTKWDRLALRLAVGHLLSWESWNHRTAAEHASVLHRLTGLQSQLAESPSRVDQLRGYEADRHDELRRIALASDDSPFRINRRMLRGWDRVRDAWMKSDSAENRLALLTQLQTKMIGKFGDPDLYRWLAQEGREHLWQDQELVPLLAKCNDGERLLARTKEDALYTSPDPRLHPKWLNYEPKGGSNLYTYDLIESNGDLALVLPLLSKENGVLRECAVARLPLAPSKQLAEPHITTNEKERRLQFRMSHQSMSGVLRAGDVIFDRRHLENRHFDAVGDGDVGSVWFKLVLDVDSQAPSEWLDARGRVATPASVHYFNSALSATSRHSEGLEPGLRVLSVDLGVRTFAACSVFELVADQPSLGLSFLADEDKGLWAKHERSFLLSLPGEHPSSASRVARTEAYQELHLLRRTIGHLKSILRLSVKDSPSDRREAIGDLLTALREENDDVARVKTEVKVAELHLATGLPRDDWHSQVAAIYKDLERETAALMSEWRKRTRKKTAAGRQYDAGKSDWAIEYLSNVRNLLRSWTLHGREYGQVNRADRDKQGVFAASLLQHINDLKEDRVKSGTDLIIQAARGYVPANPKGWVKRYDPCRLILFEDLARYRFRTDRPRRENAQLMRWSHRQIINEAEMQGEIYGLIVGKTGAGFSSRFHAASGSAGCRTRVLTTEDLTSIRLKPALQNVADQMGFDVCNLVAGMRIPWQGGGEFTTINAAGEPLTVHADLNAAQNLQRRFWTRHGDAYRITAFEVRAGEQELWYPTSDGKRFLGAIAALVGGSGHARLVPADDNDGFVLEAIPQIAWRRVVGASDTSDESESDELTAQLDDILGEDDAERGSGRKVFFRDPSGRVLRPDRWYETKIFWGRVTKRVVKALGLAGSSDH
ncbi:MAG: type V CRISPR-associated protein Cas12b [Planctomycetota bacterium]|nr:type V CRISPR-associated protein Cas12b [Planctomycetota bacterium]